MGGLVLDIVDSDILDSAKPDAVPYVPLYYWFIPCEQLIGC